MKNKKLLLISLIFFFTIILFSNIVMAKDLDVINDYTITVEPRNDGSLDIIYNIEWEVLDSTSEGPLTWVQIGIPNSKVDSVRALTSNIQSARYSNNNGHYVRIDFKNDYHAGDVINFGFSIHQKYMYTLKDNTCQFEFTPGWFGSLVVKNITVYWNAENVLSSTAKETNSDNYLVWSGSLRKGGKLKTKVIYDIDTFNVSKSKQASELTSSTTTYNNYSTNTSGITSLVYWIVFLSILISILSIFTGTGYRSHGGYGYGYGHRGYGSSYNRSIRSSSSRSSCVSSCACACACAGGGRAGCSKKDFYGTNLKTKQLNKILNKK